MHTQKMKATKIKDGKENCMVLCNETELLRKFTYTLWLCSAGCAVANVVDALLDDCVCFVRTNMNSI